MYELTVRTRFAAAHSLRGYQGECENIHGHTWQVDVTVKAGQLNDIGLGIDFRELKAKLQSIVRRYDHTCLNDLEEFQNQNPSSEILAREIFHALSRELSSLPLKVTRVRVWESPDAAAAYVEE